ncbi:MAG: LytTR family transcriptional regulator [Candidatus Zixiibacteriota bacterium]|nr:MAG: LytTR family transcriptional regulator [candidate division Zixibacteria bacterium]
MLRILTRPHPVRYETGYDLKVSALVALFVLVFLLAFEPFGLSHVRSGLRYYLIGGYTLVCFMVLLLNLLLVPRLLKSLFDEEKWTVLKTIVWQLWIVFCVGVGSYLWALLFDAISDFHGRSFGFFLYLQMATLVIALPCIVVINLLNQNHLLRRNLELSVELSAKLEIPEKPTETGPEPEARVALTSENDREKYELTARDILFASSQGNYTNVIVGRQSPEKVFIRSSLKRIARQLADYPFLVRCHRAYIVNIDKVKRVTGNAQGLKLTLEQVERPIPVARQYTKELRRRAGLD